MIRRSIDQLVWTPKISMKIHHMYGERHSVLFFVLIIMTVHEEFKSSSAKSNHVHKAIWSINPPSVKCATIHTGRSSFCFDLCDVINNMNFVLPIIFSLQIAPWLSILSIHIGSHSFHIKPTLWWGYNYKSMNLSKTRNFCQRLN